jgi:DNA-binding SARP family transcriptional activator
VSAEIPHPGVVRLELMRGFDLSTDGLTVSIPLAAQRVIAFLALAARPLHRIYVAGNLWLDSSEEHANSSLRTALWRLRRTGLHVVDATSTRLTICQDVEVDVRELGSAAESAIVGSCDVDVSPALAELLAAGDLLPDWYDDWVIIERERLRQLRLHALEALCTSLREERRFGEAVLAGMAAVAAEPLRESAHREVIATFLAEGNVADALRQYELLRRLLKSQLGLAPSAAVDDLVAPLPIR